MRIIGEIEHPVYKITVFSMNNRLSVKIEDKLIEQVFKFRDGSGIDGVEDIKSFLNDDFMKSVDESFRQLSRARITSLMHTQASEDEFDEIV
ncbi:MAG: hypothetical protein HKN68_03480 [Saprospiraceae bacterium]|nr:hypothetical protein [Saprospiraceae bacterium]